MRVGQGWARICRDCKSVLACDVLTSKRLHFGRYKSSFLMEYLCTLEGIPTHSYRKTSSFLWEHLRSRVGTPLLFLKQYTDAEQMLCVTAILNEELSHVSQAGYFCESGANSSNAIVDTITAFGRQKSGLCPPGHYCWIGATVPIPCPAGKIQMHDVL